MLFLGKVDSSILGRKRTGCNQRENEKGFPVLATPSHLLSSPKSHASSYRRRKLATATLLRGEQIKRAVVNKKSEVKLSEGGRSEKREAWRNHLHKPVWDGRIILSGGAFSQTLNQFWTTQNTRFDISCMLSSRVFTTSLFPFLWVSYKPKRKWIYYLLWHEELTQLL